MQPDPGKLLKMIGITTPPVGFYDSPTTEYFEPFAESKHCFFSCYANWLKGESILITRENFTCMGAGYWLCNVLTRPRADLVKFLVEIEGLKSSPERMDEWLDHRQPYQQEHPNIIIGPLKNTRYASLKTVTFFVNPDQLSALMTGAQYHSATTDPPPVIAPFGSGCSQLAALFEDLNIPQALIGATDMAMRQYLPPDILAFTVTRKMFERLCDLGENSFLYKPFWATLQKARGLLE